VHSAPRVVNANGDPNSVVVQVHWKHWGAKQALGYGKSREFALKVVTCLAGSQCNWSPRTRAAAAATDLGSTGGCSPATSRGTAAGQSGPTGPTCSIRRLRASARRTRR
jgi:hypothetical protein